VDLFIFIGVHLNWKYLKGKKKYTEENKGEVKRLF
jgi:hypothetical protein